jgi:hypothetical protein
MNNTTKIILISSIALVIGGATYFGVKKYGKKKKVDSFDDALKSGLISGILANVISANGSKKYTDVLPLDGGTVGIAHYAVGGLAELYNEMDTEKYFGKSKSEMISNYSNGCRPSGKSGNDTGWGCYSKSWWRDGMTKFVKSSESKKVQDTAWAKKMKKVVDSAISKGWNKPRQIAIATGIANSFGASGFNSLATKNNWDSEKTLAAYVQGVAHRQSRVDAINKHYPLT